MNVGNRKNLDLVVPFHECNTYARFDSFEGWEEKWPNRPRRAQLLRVFVVLARTMAEKVDGNSSRGDACSVAFRGSRGGSGRGFHGGSTSPGSAGPIGLFSRVRIRIENRVFSISRNFRFAGRKYRDLVASERLYPEIRDRGGVKTGFLRSFGSVSLSRMAPSAKLSYVSSSSRMRVA